MPVEALSVNPLHHPLPDYRLAPEVVGYIDDDGVGPCEQGALEGYGRLVVQYALPEVVGHKLGQDHRDGLARVGVVDGVDVGQDGGDEGAVGRLDDDDGDFGDDLIPAPAQVLGLFHVVADVERRHVVRDAAGVLYGPADGLVHSVYGHQHGLAAWSSVAPWPEGGGGVHLQLLPDAVVVP